MNAIQITNLAEVESRKPLTVLVFQKYINYIEGTEATKTTYTRALKQMFNYLQTHYITYPTREDLMHYRDALQGKKPATVQLYMQACKLFFAWTSCEGYYPNIAERLKGAKIDREHKKDYLTAEQVKTILASIDTSTIEGKRNYAIMVLCITAGLRVIEVARANIEDLTTIGGNSVIYIQGKGHEEKAQFVRLNPKTEAIMRSYLAERTDNSEALFVGLSNNNKNNRLTTRSISGIIKETMKRAGFNSERLTAHSLRHTAITLALLGGQSLEEAQQFARHSRIDTTMIYNHALQREQNGCSGAIADAIL